MSRELSYDDLLFPILHNKEQIADFFDVIFEFLYRRTDFFKIQKDGSSNFGLHDGVAKDIVLKAFCKYFQLALLDENLHLKSNEIVLPPDYSAEEIVTTETDDYQKILHNNEVVDPITGFTKGDNLDCVTEQQKEMKDLESENKVYQSYSETYNGAAYDNYCWSQTIKDIDVHVKVPKDVCSGKQVKVDISQHFLRVEALQDQQWNLLASGDFTWKINVDESTWTLVPNEHIHICIEKIKQRWWDSLFLHEPKIDVRTIDASQPYEDLDYDSQSKIQELMYKEHQKRLGNPTVLQSRVQDALKEAWNQDGSPFRGTPYDPSQLQIVDSDSSCSGIN